MLGEPSCAEQANQLLNPQQLFKFSQVLIQVLHVCNMPLCVCVWVCVCVCGCVCVCVCV